MQTALDPDPQRIDDQPEETHVVCCDDHEHSLCGTIVEWSGPPQEDGGPSCVVCFDLNEANYCPYTGICRHAERKS